MGRTGGYSIKYYIKDKKFTKADIIERIQKLNGYETYLPDDIKFTSLSRDYLITVNNNIFYDFKFFNFIGPPSDQSGSIRGNVQ